MSTVIHISGLPARADPASIYWELRHHDPSIVLRITEIYGLKKSSNDAWIEFSTHDSAMNAIVNFDGMVFGPWEKQCRIFFTLVDKSEIAWWADKQLSDFLRERDVQPDSCVVKVLGLPAQKTQHYLNKLLRYEITRNGNGNEETDKQSQCQILNPCIIEETHILKNEPGAAFVRWNHPLAARHAVHRYSGMYFQNNSVYLHTVPNSFRNTNTNTNTCPPLPLPRNPTTSTTAQPRPNKPTTSTTTLFVHGIKPRTSVQEICKLFKPTVIKGVSLPSREKAYCFIEVEHKDAKYLLWWYGKGVKVQGRTVRVFVAREEERVGREW